MATRDVIVETRAGELRFTVPGDPKPLMRHRTTRTGLSYDPAGNREAKAVVRVVAHQAMQAAGLALLDEPLGIEVVCHLWRPKSAPRRRVYPTTKPDGDNLLKLVLDALNGVVWRDDACVCDMRVVKRYAKSTPHTEVRVYGLQFGG